MSQNVSKILFRIEHPHTKFGMWNTKCDKGNSLVSYLSNRVVADLPMPPEEIYGQNGRRWYSAADSLEMLNYWFKIEDIRELLNLGFRVYEIECMEYQKKDQEMIFTKESIIDQTDITHMFEESPIQKRIKVFAHFKNSAAQYLDDLKKQAHV